MTVYISEPHPTVVKNTYIHSGRGGAGNFFKAPATTPASGVPTPITSVVSNTLSSTGTTTTSSSNSNNNRFYSGRGGAGNAHVAADRPCVFDEFSRLDAREKTAAMGHVGRGGAGNVFRAAAKKERKHSSASSTTSSHRASNESSSSGFLARLSLSKH